MSEITNFSLDAVQVRQQFPLLQTSVDDKPLVYLDSAATSQKPQCVIDAIATYYSSMNANVHRGVYALSHEATIRYEACRQTARNFINAGYNHEIIFTSGATESMNLVAYGFGKSMLEPGDEVLISSMEHHSTIVPWQVACESSGATLKVIPLDDRGEINLEAYRTLLTDKTKIVALIHVSNVLGTINPIQSMISMAHERGIPVVVDGAQAPTHIPIDVQALDCDFYTFSGHKAYGPTGIGILYGKQEWLEKLPPYQCGGDMIKSVSFDHTEYNVLPYKFEAGTPNVAGVIGLSEALHFIESLGVEAIQQHEQTLLQYATEQLRKIPGLTIHGSANEKIGIISFTMTQAHPHDIATIMADNGIAIRAGHHCAMPLIELLAVPATARVSLGVYNTREDIDQFIHAIDNVIDIFSE